MQQLPLPPQLTERANTLFFLACLFVLVQAIFFFSIPVLLYWIMRELQNITTALQQKPLTTQSPRITAWRAPDPDPNAPYKPKP